MKRARPYYYDTTPMSRDEAIRSVRTARRQEEAVLAFFRAAPAGRFAPSQVMAACERQGKRWPLTSIRRAITNLTSAGALVHLHDMTRPGLYGKPETLWRLAE